MRRRRRRARNYGVQAHTGLGDSRRSKGPWGRTGPTGAAVAARRDRRQGINVGAGGKSRNQG